MTQTLLPLFIRWDINPTLFSIGSIEIRYYSLFWVLGLMISAFLFHHMMKREGMSEKMFDSIFWYGTLSTIIGSRLGHCLFYDPVYYLSNPIEIFNIREGGLASHGAAIGLLVGLWLFSRKNKLPYIWSLDRISIAVTITGALVRLGNLMNSEIYGTETSLPWGFIFVQRGEMLPMHPTQIYEALVYFALFAVLLWMYYKREIPMRRPGVMFGFFLIVLFGSRILIESIKNVQEAFEADMMLNMGQILSIPFVLAGIAILYLSLRKKPIDTRKKAIKRP